MKLAAEQERALHRDKRDRDYCRADHCESFCESKWMEALAFLSRQREHWNKRKNNDRH